MAGRDSSTEFVKTKKKLSPTSFPWKNEGLMCGSIKKTIKTCKWNYG